MSLLFTAYQFSLVQSILQSFQPESYPLLHTCLEDALSKLLVETPLTLYGYLFFLLMMPVGVQQGSMDSLFCTDAILSMRKLLHFRAETSLPPQGSNLDRLQRILQIPEISDLLYERNPRWRTVYVRGSFKAVSVRLFPVRTLRPA